MAARGRKPDAYWFQKDQNNKKKLKRKVGPKKGENWAAKINRAYDEGKIRSKTKSKMHEERKKFNKIRHKHDW